MAYKITDQCIGCGTCASVCPCGAIEEDGNVYKINPDLCAECGTCAESCPNSAIVQD